MRSRTQYIFIEEELNQNFDFEFVFKKYVENNEIKSMDRY
jgi:hypothetical protein